jgi:hypothetical protein
VNIIGTQSRQNITTLLIFALPIVSYTYCRYASHAPRAARNLYEQQYPHRFAVEYSERLPSLTLGG